MANIVILTGEVAYEPDSRYINDKKKISFKIKVERDFVNQDGTRYADYHNVVAWDKVAEFEATNLAKGDSIMVTGTLRSRSYEVEGQKRYVTEVSANSIQVFGGAEGPQEEEQVSVPDMNSLPDLKLDDDTDDLPF